MALFDRLSRYVKPPLATYQVIDVRGRQVSALPVPEAPREISAGVHVRKQGETLDQLAFGFLADAHAFWRIAEVNGAVLPDAIAEAESLKIPAPTR
jgi:nucleoid-associated protein YgaU